VSASSLAVKVTAEDDAPAGTDTTVTTNEDRVYTFTAADFGFTDADGDAFAAISLTTLSGRGQLTLDGVPVAPAARVTLSDIDSGKLQFTPASEDNGGAYATFTFQVQDDSGAALDADLDQTPNTLTINVAPVDDGPNSVPTLGGLAASITYAGSGTPQFLDA